MAKVFINCDNSACEKDIKVFEFTLTRRNWCKDTGQYGWSSTGTRDIVENKGKGLLKKSSGNCEIEL